MNMKRKFILVVRLFTFVVIVWMLPLDAILSICYVYVSKDYMTAKDAPSGVKRIGMIILRSFVGYLVLAIVLIWAMEIQGVTMRNLLYAFIAWELTLFLPLDTHDPIAHEKGFDAPKKDLLASL
jgi:hypothetical protein